MKKLLLILPLFLIFPSLASANISNPAPPSDKFQTAEYKAFKAFGLEQEEAKDTPISEEERAKANDTAEVLFDAAIGSFRALYQKDLVILQNS